MEDLFRFIMIMGMVVVVLVVRSIDTNLEIIAKKKKKEATK